MQFIFNLLKIRRERNLINKLLHNLQPELFQIEYSYILYPIVRILEIIKQTIITKFITQIPAFPPFTKQQIEEESLQIFNDFLDTLSHKGQLNVVQYIKNQKKISYEEQLKLAIQTKSNIKQPNDFKRQSAIQLKHISGSIKKPKSSNINGDDNYRQQNNQTFDLLYIFLGDIHNHKLFEDEEYLQNQIQHMNPDYWRSKYSPIMHKISECLEDELDENIHLGQNGQCTQNWQQQKQEFCCILRAICQMVIELFKSLNTATLYYYWVQFSFQKFLNRAQKIGDSQAQRLQMYERNYKQHLQDFINQKSNYLREYRNRRLLDQAEREFIKIILNI